MEQVKPWHPFRLKGLCGLREGVEEAELHIPAADKAENNRVSADEKINNNNSGDPGAWPRWRNNHGTSTAEYAQTYFCEHPCGWGEVKAYTKPVSYGKDERLRVAKRNSRGHNKDGMTVMITGLKASDGGRYYCCIDVPGTDWYETYNIVVGDPAPQLVKPLVEPAYEPATKEETAWMGNEDAVQGQINPSVRKAMMQCQGNKACTLALLQKEELKINTSCWLCLQMSHSWRAAPPTVAAIRETGCLIPEQMTEVLMAGAEIEKGRIPRRQPEHECKETRPRLKLKAGWSDCRIRINIGNGTADNCTAIIDGKQMAFTCPFSRP
ncbi:hypothetical protein M9458_052543, partial [Cirrhinus mrigala]